ncbi:protocadherin Fat 3-like [Clupea harengus]|uniref:Protocadherin Fat 3-like n=1 Tax=Clupea harengus TaxID=7950 RepID=A0A6P8EPV5_CLUHA|nr:protocadherin Fat 3-like [Clupea harengus]
MGTSPCVLIALFSACWITNVIHSLPLTTTPDCSTGLTVHLGEIDEGYTGDIEIIPSVPDGGLELNLELCPQCSEFLEFISSFTNATLRTKKPLDTEAFRETAGVVSYQINCTSSRVENGRTLIVRDLNDNAPVFEKEEYRANVSETSPVGEIVVQVKAVDADFSPAHNHITYSIQPPSQTFEASGSGQILLKERLNYTIASQYNFTAKAQDDAGNFSQTQVIINIIDQLRPEFEYNPYEASVPENQVSLPSIALPLPQSTNSVTSDVLNYTSLFWLPLYILDLLFYQVGPVLEVLPAPIQANPSEESNYTIIYSISEVSPSDYQNNFNVDQVTGVIRVVTELDFEEIKDNINISVKASLEIDSTRTANTLVMY